MKRAKQVGVGIKAKHNKEATQKFWANSMIRFVWIFSKKHYWHFFTQIWRKLKCERRSGNFYSSKIWISKHGGESRFEGHMPCSSSRIRRWRFDECPYANSYQSQLSGSLGRKILGVDGLIDHMMYTQSLNTRTETPLEKRVLFAGILYFFVIAFSYNRRSSEIALR